MDLLWSFLYTALDFFPFLPLLYYALGKTPSRRRIWLGIGVSTLFMLIQGVGFALFYPQNATNLHFQLTYRELCVMSYLIPVILVSKVPARKALFLFCVLLPVSLLAVSISYLPTYIPSATVLFTHPCAEECLLRIGLILLLYFPLLWFFGKILRPAMEIDSSQVWSMIWLVPLFLSSLSLLFTHHYFRTDFYILFVILRTFVALGSLTCCAILLQSLRLIADFATARTETEQSKRLLAIQEEQYRIVTRNIADTRAMRHDLRHQLFMIRTLTKDQKYEQLLEFVNTCTADTPLNTELIVCDNYIVNSIATHYLAMARENDIHVSLSIAPLSDSLPISDTDLCILIGNSMENAIEACKKLPPDQRTIDFHIKTIASHLTMTIDNSYDGILVRDGERFISTKREGAQEGIGIRSIRSVAEKYGGEIRIGQKNQLFMLSVLIPLR